MSAFTEISYDILFVRIGSYPCSEGSSCGVHILNKHSIKQKNKLFDIIHESNYYASLHGSVFTFPHTFCEGRVL